MGDADFMRVDFQFFSKACSTMSGISFLNGTKFCRQILQRGQSRFAFAHQLRDAVGQNIDHADFLPLVAQVRADIYSDSSSL